MKQPGQRGNFKIRLYLCDVNVKIQMKSMGLTQTSFVGESHWKNKEQNSFFSGDEAMFHSYAHADLGKKKVSLAAFNHSKAQLTFQNEC